MLGDTMKQTWLPTAGSPVGRHALWATMCCVAAIATACGGSGSNQQATASASASIESTATSAAGAPAAKLTIANFNFGQPITVPPGAQIAVTNADSAEHSVTSDTAGKFDVEVAGGKGATLTAPTEPGSYPLHCKYHPSMHGTLIVQ
jgi:plastocyanin